MLFQHLLLAETNLSPEETPMINRHFQKAVSIGALVFALGGIASAQSSRPRRVKPAPKPADEPLLRPERSTATTAKTDPNAPLITVQPVKPVGSPVEGPSAGNSSARNPSASTPAVSASDTANAYRLLQQKQFAAAAKEAKAIAANFPNEPEAWKIAGFAELNLKQYSEAVSDLEKAVKLQRTAKQEDPNTVDALAQAYVLSEKFEPALPLLVTATTRAGAQPDASMLYYRGLAEYKTGKLAEAELSFNSVIKLNPRDALSLFYLGQISLNKNDLDAAISALNRATLNDARLASAWTLLTSVYLRRAAAATDTAKADADYLNAVRAGEGLIKVRTDAEAVTLFGQALIGSQQYARAAAALERATIGSEAKGVTFYLLGIAQSRAKNFPKAIAALETAATKTPGDVNVYRELGYAYEVSKQYSKALTAYQKGANLAPGDTDFKESIERVRPFAK